MIYVKVHIKRINNTKSYLFEDIFDINEREGIVNIFEKCNCCEDHKKNRLTFVDYKNGYCPPYSTRYSKKRL